MLCLSKHPGFLNDVQAAARSPDDFVQQMALLDTARTEAKNFNQLAAAIKLGKI
jgi:hypothetical protein